MAGASPANSLSFYFSGPNGSERRNLSFICINEKAQLNGWALIQMATDSQMQYHRIWINLRAESLYHQAVEFIVTVSVHIV